MNNSTFFLFIVNAFGKQHKFSKKYDRKNLNNPWKLDIGDKTAIFVAVALFNAMQSGFHISDVKSSFS